MRELRTRNHVLSKATQQLLSELEFKPCMSEFKSQLFPCSGCPAWGLALTFMFFLIQKYHLL